MKLNKKVVDLISEGFKANTLKNLTETQIDKLHERVVGSKVNEQSGVVKQTKNVTTTKIPRSVAQTQGVDVPNKGKVNVSADSSGNVQVTELSEKKNKNNPWAICKAQQNKVGKDKMTDKEVESCIKKLKKEKTVKENLFIEKKILNLVEKYTLPKMSKQEFLSILEASETKEKPDVKEKPKTSPGTKTPPKEKPFDPFKPSPSKQPKPKAKKSEPKEQVMDAPAKPKTQPTTKPGTKTPPKEKPFDPFKPSPSKQPKPKAGKKLPSILKFNEIGIKFKK